MKNSIRIVEGVRDIHEVFGYKNDMDYIADLGAQNSYGERLRYLTFIFMELVAKGEERMFMSYMLSKVLSALSKKKLNTPTMVLSYLNDNLNNGELEHIFASCGTASMQLRGGGLKSIEDLMKEIKDGKEGK